MLPGSSAGRTPVSWVGWTWLSQVRPLVIKGSTPLARRPGVSSARLLTSRTSARRAGSFHSSSGSVFLDVVTSFCNGPKHIVPPPSVRGSRAHAWPAVSGGGGQNTCESLRSPLASSLTRHVWAWGRRQRSQPSPACPPRGLEALALTVPLRGRDDS